MNQNEHTYWKIHDYLKGRLEGNILADFENEIKNNLALQEHVDIHRIANKVIINNRLSGAKQTSLDIQNADKKRIFYKKIAISTVVTVSLLSAIYLLFKTERVRQESIIQPKEQVTSSTKVESITTKTTPIQSVTEKIALTASSKKAAQNQIESATIPSKITETSPIVIETKEENAAAQVISIPTEQKKTEVIRSISEAEKIETLCAKTAITATASAAATCNNQHNGSILVSGFRGGKAPYKYEIVSERSKKILINNQLPAGKYTILVSDDNHCETTIEHIMVKEVSCDNTIEEVFNPFLGESLILPSYHFGGTLIVHEKNGTVFYKKEFSAHENVEWNGMSQNGEMETGHFMYEIHYQDGIRKLGTITITR